MGVSARKAERGWELPVAVAGVLRDGQQLQELPSAQLPISMKRSTRQVMVNSLRWAGPDSWVTVYSGNRQPFCTTSSLEGRNKGAQDSEKRVLTSSPPPTLEASDSELKKE